MLELNQRVIFISKDCLFINRYEMLEKTERFGALYLIDWMHDSELLLTSEKLERKRKILF